MYKDIYVYTEKIITIVIDQHFGTTIKIFSYFGYYLLLRAIVLKYFYFHVSSTCPLNQNDVFWIAQRVEPIFLHSGHLLGSGDMCRQIKSIYFLVLLAKKWVKKA